MEEIESVKVLLYVQDWMKITWIDWFIYGIGLILGNVIDPIKKPSLSP